MDFASLMKKELSNPSSSPVNKNSSAITSKASSEKAQYLKKAELEKQRQDAYVKEQAAIRLEREERLAKKRKLEDEEVERKADRDEKRRRLAEESRRRREEEEARKERARRKRLGLPPLPEVKDGQGENEEPKPVDEALLATIEANKNLPIPTTIALLPESELRVPPLPPQKPEELSYLYRQLASYFTLLLRAWASALANRDSSVSQTIAGKQALNAYNSSVQNLRALFAHFEKGDLANALLEPLLEIVYAAQERRYVDANDAYLRLSIGKAAWPIGVTMVGIHERSAREKLSESGERGVAHIMSDEGTRKWLQSLKRCLSFAQTRWPPEDIGQLMG